MNTNDLIERIVERPEPVAPLPSPGRRTAVWLLGAAAYVGVLVAAVAVLDGTAPAAPGWPPQLAAAATAILAAGAAFASVVPGAAGSMRGWAAAAALLWLAAVVAATPGNVDWAAVPEARHEWWCVGFIVLGGAPLAGVLAWMLKRGAPLAPATTAACAALAVAALTNVGACFSVPHPNGAVTIAWHGGVTLLLVIIAAANGRRLFSWRRA
jgi:hypothetical protein